jgi:hypothetical protein
MKMPEQQTCADVPWFDRLQYFYGQMLGAADFQAEQSYFRDKLKLHNRCLHGYGAVCGLSVAPAIEPEGPCGPEDKAKEEGRICARVVVGCGLALDPQGNELVVRQPVAVDLWARLGEEERAQVKKGEPFTVWLSVRFQEVPIQPTRAVSPDGCGQSRDCQYGRVREHVRFEVSLTKPAEDARCEPCCDGAGACPDALLLARIDVDPKRELSPQDIQNGVRRMLSVYVPTRIVGISWKHGGSYSQREARDVLGTDKRRAPPQKALEIALSRPILTDTLKPGVLDVWVVKGGRGEHGPVSPVDGEFVWDGPKPRTTQLIRYRQTDDETFNNGDRILITLRGAFVLDECARPLDGANVGGLVPQLPQYRAEKPAREERREPAREERRREPQEEFRGEERRRPREEREAEARYEKEAAEYASVVTMRHLGPWTSGIGLAGTTFESWFYIKRDTSDE